MRKIKIDRYFTPNSFLSALNEKYLEKHSEGLLFDFGDIPEDYEVVIRSIINKHQGEHIIYQNLKERY